MRQWPEIIKRLENRRAQLKYVEDRPNVTNRRRKAKKTASGLSWIGICPYCNEKTDAPVVDHIVPIAHGGTDDSDNLTLCCARCNRQKNSKKLIVFLADRMKSNVDKYWDCVIKDGANAW